MQDYFVHLRDSPAENRVRELITTMENYGLVTVRVGISALKFRMRAEGMMVLTGTGSRQQFDAVIAGYNDVYREFPPLPRR